MKVLINEVETEGLECLLGKVITVWCAAYIYTGKLAGVSTTCIKLEDPKIVYETGPFSEKKWKDAQSLGTDTWYVQLAAVEAFGVMNKV